MIWIIQTKQVTNALKGHFGNSLVVLLSSGTASILTFRKSCHFRLQNSNNIDDKDVKEFSDCIKTEIGRPDRILYKIQTIYVMGAVTH